MIGTPVLLHTSPSSKLSGRGKYQGIIGVFATVGYGIGPIVGGALAQADWRVCRGPDESLTSRALTDYRIKWVFWLTIPIALCAILVVNFVLPLKSVAGDIKKYAYLAFVGIDCRL